MKVEDNKENIWTKFGLFVLNKLVDLHETNTAICRPGKKGTEQRSYSTMAAKLLP